MPDPLSPLKNWETFYFLVGTSAAALVGIQFVVMAFVGESGAPGGEDTLGAFGTPTVVHLGMVLLVSAVLVAPWASLPAAGLVVAITGLVGIGYAALTIARARRQTHYEPVLEDWMFHAVLPTLAHLGVAAAGLFVVRRHPEGGLFVLAAATLLLLFIAIHNAWDTATYVAMQRRTRHPNEAPTAPPAPPV